MAEITVGRVRNALLRWARATEEIGRTLREVALVYTMLLGGFVVFVVALGSC